MSKLALETKTKEQEMFKAYLEENAGELLIEKINNGVKIQKNGKTLLNMLFYVQRKDISWNLQQKKPKSNFKKAKFV